VKPDAALAARCEAFDLLATMVALVDPEGTCLYANTAFENVLGLPRRSLVKAHLQDWFTDPEHLQETVRAVSRNQYATGRFDAQLKRPGAHAELLPTRW
jgi:two-component system nitrogen regulation sensor histidine kinase GlnL